MKKIRLTSYFAFFVNGMLAVMTGTILSYLVRDYNISYTVAGKLVSVQSIGNMITVLLSGFIIHLLGRKKVLMIFPILFAVGFGGILCTRSVPVLYLLMTLTGIGWALCNNVLNIIIMEDSKAGGAGISILYTSYAVGSFMGPFLVLLITSIGLSWKFAVLLVAVSSLALLPGFYHKGMFSKEETQTNRESITRKDLGFLKNIKYYICVILYFGYIGVEVAVNSWLITYLVNTNRLSEKTAQTMFSIYWLIAIFGRLFAAAFLSKIKREVLLLIQWIGFGVSISAVLFTGAGAPSIIAVICMAIFMSAISPVNAENADIFIKGKGISGGIMFAVGCLGSTILPYLVGKLTDIYSERTGFMVIVSMAYCMIIVSVINKIVKTKKKNPA